MPWKVFYTGTQGLASNLYIGVVDVTSGKVTPFPNLRASRALGLVSDFLVYVHTDGARVYDRIADRVMEATLAFSPTLMVTGRRTLFAEAYATDIYHPNYDVAPDGKSFVMVRPAGESRRLVMVLNWARELERLRGGATKR